MLPTPHDALFKAVFGEPAHARGALQAVMPAALAEKLDWPTLARCPGSFVDPDLRERHTDLLFSVRWRGGGETPIYLLFEHQSTPDVDMPLRLLRYMNRIWDRWRTEQPERATLPFVLPIVLFHGTSPWSAPRSFDALFELPADVRRELEPHLVRFSYVLDDLSDVADAVLQMRAMTALSKLVELCFKHARTRADFLSLLADWSDLLRAVVNASHGREALALVMRYILEVSDHVEPEDLQALLDRAVGPEAKDSIMTAGQRLIQQGRAEGVQQGRAEGVQQGRAEGAQEAVSKALVRLLRQRFGAAVDAFIEQRISAASFEQINSWTDRVLSAPTLRDVFAD